MLDLCAHFGNPQRGHFKVVHVAGTNGKGSVTFKTAAALQEMGFKVGMFISPHISSFRERF
jgi:dihydrofolate synthase / folylpolyglutamate synthase